MRRGDAALIVVVYVVPLAGATVLLALAGLGGIALALLAVEAAVSAAVVIARRTRPGRDARPGPATRPWLVPLVMIAVLLAIVGIAVVASQIG